MKLVKLKTLSFFIIFATVLSSCKKDGGGNEIAKGKAEIKASWSGASSGNFESSLTVSTSVKASPLIVLTGASVSLPPKTCQISFPVSITAGTYNQSGSTVNGITLLFSDGAKGYAIGGAGATGFTVTVTSVSDSEIKGTFSGQLGNGSDNSKITIANGTFQGKF
nr:hypothetical protein [uncultured Lacibacter sp.]